MANFADKYLGLALSASEVKSLTGWPDALVEDYTSTLNSLRQLAQEIVTTAPTTGTGNPNGVVTSNASLLYVDVSGPTLYVNSTVGVNTGWVAV